MSKLATEAEIDQWLPRAGVGEWVGGVVADGFRVSLWGDEIFLKLIVIMVAQLTIRKVMELYTLHG